MRERAGSRYRPSTAIYHHTLIYTVRDRANLAATEGVTLEVRNSMLSDLDLTPVPSPRGRYAHAHARPQRSTRSR